MKFKKGDRIIWSDAIVGACIGTVTNVWRDSRIGLAMYVVPDHHEPNSRYPINVADDKPHKLPKGFPVERQRVDAGPRHL